MGGSKISSVQTFWRANRFGVGTGVRVIDQVITSISLWPTFADEAGVPKPVALSIANFHLLDMGRLDPVRGSGARLLH